MNAFSVRGQVSTTIQTPEGKTEETKTFYEKLQSILDKRNTPPFITIVGCYGEEMYNKNGKLFRHFASYNNLKLPSCF